MKTLHNSIAVIFLSLFSLFIMSSCKTKKLAAKPIAATQVTTPANKPSAVQPTVPAVTKDNSPAVAIAKPHLNFKRIQFDFNSAVLKTGSIQFLDQAAVLIKEYPGHHFILNGYASAEGTPQHNMLLSQERANAVKSYLVNDGIDQSEFTVKGYGEADPIASNKTETGRVANRRVEFSLAQ